MVKATHIGALPEGIILFGVMHAVATAVCIFGETELPFQFKNLAALWNRYFYQQVFFYGIFYIVDLPKWMKKYIKIYLSVSQFRIINSCVATAAIFDAKPAYFQLPSRPIGELSLMVVSMVVVLFLMVWLYDEGDGHVEDEEDEGPSYPTTNRLVVSGPFGFVRNPIMAVAVFSNFVIQVIMKRSLRALICLSIITTTLTWWLKHVEEPDLRERFGKRYMTYKENVPRWIPRMTYYKEAEEYRREHYD